ncbi:hypothetical protein SAMN05444166_7110 [Singulisphaera sp. GP187]|uniref:hypothetical protein n=1 Tax=Singulisphaera sp. GP187 TaxID=1882752 RepID=UPI00092A6D97|nr:hypothetical protein [Singulisphaera sp. GP187]SIO62652.1 hypothetical protein SAMN05444166_7110 [Singulisphaera sp. GP187]
MNQFKRWPLILSALMLEAWIGVSLYFAPGWANGWPFGLTIYRVWSGGMAVIGCLMFVTLAAGIRAAICPLRLRYLGEFRFAWLVCRAWLMVCAIATAILGMVIYRTLIAETLKMWPNGYHP